MDVSGPQALIKLGTMYAVEDIVAEKITGLLVSTEDNSMSIPLPKAFSRETIPAQTARTWYHLSSIANEIPKYRDDVNWSCYW